MRTTRTWPCGLRSRAVRRAHVRTLAGKAVTERGPVPREIFVRGESLAGAHSLPTSVSLGHLAPGKHYAPQPLQQAVRAKKDLWSRSCGRPGRAAE